MPLATLVVCLRVLFCFGFHVMRNNTHVEDYTIFTNQYITEYTESQNAVDKHGIQLFDTSPMLAFQWRVWVVDMT